MKFVIIAFVLFVGVAAAMPIPVPSRTHWSQLESTGYSFSHFVEEFSKVYDDADYVFRHAVFNKTLEQVLQHNKENKSWKLGINHMSDWSDDEYRALLGYKKGAHASLQNSLTKSTPYVAKSINIHDLPKHVDWREKGSVTPVKDQGRCGSCYAFASTETVESFWFLKTGNLVELSTQQAAFCTSNPTHCGGFGGCLGGISELVYESIIANGGMASQWTYPYVSHEGQNASCGLSKTTPSAATISSYVKLPENEYLPVLEAVANKGPVSITVDASTWKNYAEGVFNGCNQDEPDLNHLVQLVGYGEENGQKYWLIRNSWTSNWGERGYMKLLRTDNEAELCGIDKHPQDGSGCDGGPATVKTCGHCGIVYDVAYPVV